MAPGSLDVVELIRVWTTKAIIVNNAKLQYFCGRQYPCCT